MNRLKKGISIALSMGLITWGACSTASRKPAAQDFRESNELAQEVHQTYLDITSPEFNSETCVSYLEEMYRKINYGQAIRYGDDKILRDFPTINRELWSIRQALHQKLPSVSKECALEMKSAFRAIRAVEDYLGEKYYKITPAKSSEIEFQKQPVPILDHRAYPPFFVAEGTEQKNFRFEAGDVVITRGISFLSAMIARVSDVKSQFSHVVFVHQEGGGLLGSNRVHTIESYVGSGVGIYDLDFALKNENARIMVLRPKDRALAKTASDWLYKTVKKRVDEKKPIPYDYEFNFNDHSALSCAEVAQFAYENASKGEFVIPQYPSKIELKNTDFIERIGLHNGQLFAPGDLEIDPRFDLVLEWRDYRLVRDSRYKDAILSQMYEWMDRYGYKIQEDAQSKFAENLIWPARRTFLWPMVSAVTGVPDFSTDLSRRMFGTLAMLNQVGDILLGELTRVDSAYVGAHGWPLTNQELEGVLDLFRLMDLEAYRKGLSSQFHFAFRPDYVKP